MSATMPARGFTLIEVMVVMVIIAILITAASLSLKGDRAGDALHDEARRLAALLNLARDEAVMRDVDLGLVFTPQGYAFVQRNEGDDADTKSFVPLLDDSLFVPRSLPEGTELSFEAAAQRDPRPLSKAGNTALTPQLLARANDMLWPAGILILRHPATPRVQRVLIDMDGARLMDEVSTP